MIQMIVNRITSLVLCRLGYRREKEAEDEKFVKVSGTDRSRLIDNDYFENPDSIFQKCNRKQLIEAQKSDDSLDRVRDLVCSEPQESQSYCILESGVLFRIFKSMSSEFLKQIVVPKPYRKTILSLGHDIRFAGHLGNKKTRDRILQHFFLARYFYRCCLIS